MLRSLFPSIAFALLGVAYAGESALTVTYQPLDGLGAGNIQIVQVTCHDWLAGSMATQIGLISVPNVPPTNNAKEATEDLNLASVCGVRFIPSDIGDPEAKPELILDAMAFAVPEQYGHSKEEIIRSCLECLRRCLPAKLKKTPVTLKCKDADKEWLGKIVAEFNKKDRSKVYYTPPK